MEAARRLHLHDSIVDSVLRFLSCVLGCAGRRALLFFPFLLGFADEMNDFGDPRRDRSLDGELLAVGKGKRVERYLIFAERRKVAAGISERPGFSGEGVDLCYAARYDAARREDGLIKRINRFDDFSAYDFSGMIDAHALVERNAKRRAAGNQQLDGSSG